MLDKNFLESVLPPGDELNAAVRRCLLECFDVEEPLPVLDLDWLLTTMARFLEKDWHKAFHKKEEWQDIESPEREHDWPYQISFRGLDYKPRSNYLTEWGWGTGTICWFVTVEYGWRECICAADPRTAVLRAIVVMCAANRTSKTRPSRRRDIVEIIEQIMKEGGDAAGTIQG